MPLEWAPPRQWLSLDERMERRARLCEWHEVHACPFCGQPEESRRKRRPCEDGIDLRELALTEPHTAQRLARNARALLARGADVEVVAAETGIRKNTLHLMRSRMREENTATQE